MPRLKAFQTTRFRLAALYTLLFAGSVAVIGVVVFLSAHQVLEDQFRDRVRTEAQELSATYARRGLGEITQLVEIRSRGPAALDYRLENAKGEVLAGDLPRPDRLAGWSRITEPAHEDDPAESILALTLPLGSEGYLIVGDDLSRIEEADEAILRAFAGAVLVVFVLGALGGWALSRSFLKHVDTITRTAEAIIDGDLSRRIPPGQGGDRDLHHLATTLNRMLDRIQGLMASLRQVSDDIAHDLRTPLTRLRQRLEALLAEPQDGDSYHRGVAAAVADADAILETFSALLRIAQVEAGSRRAGFREVDLADVALTVVEAFAPSAEEGGRRLVSGALAPGAVISGDRELLTQMLVNLVENALRHTPAPSAVEVSTATIKDERLIVVTDNGPGVPADLRVRVLQRFVRLETSRTTPGSGLGLSLASAVAKLHGGRLELDDARPGLIVRARFPAAWAGPSGARSER
ncbi:ATP-binding protein [Phenylobacterium sp.]|uniref:sensor histidine kinase n=1 Tax=Phenylobacterium sp. TaxID=1871053 RepID=UPI0025FA50BC|nr:ATP-binding protein [Phenylobacterium sp.]